MDNQMNRVVAAVIMMIMLPLDILYCQEDYHPLGEFSEEILAVMDDADPSVLLEMLAELKEMPVYINDGDEEEIARLFFLTEFQVMVLADHVRRNSNVVTLYELALLPAFDRKTVMLMAPYISLRPSAGRPAKGFSRTSLSLTASARFSPDDDQFPGVRSLARLKHEQQLISFGLTAENDPGEAFTFRGAPGADFLSVWFQYQPPAKAIKKIIIGDYTMRTGEGLVFNSSQLMGSWLNAPSFISGRSTSSPYSSTEENNFMRGISIELGSRNAGAVIFVSRNRIDARILSREDSTSAGVSNLVQGGIHVTRSQIDARDSLSEYVAGVHLNAGGTGTRGGLTFAATHFSMPFIPDRTKPANLHAFDGNNLLNISADLRTGTGPLLLFTEAAISFPGSWAAVAGIRAKASGRLTFNLLARHFSPDYHAFHSGAFKAGSGSGNETGISGSVHLEAARHLFISAGADHYLIPAPRYRSSFPSSGSRTELRAEYLPHEDLSLRLSIIGSSREYDAPSGTGTAGSVINRRLQAGLIFECIPATDFRLTTRVSGSFISPSGEKGYLLCQDVSWSFRYKPLRLWFRYAISSTGGWDSRLYAWENDLLSSFSVPALHGNMTRSFIMISWKPADSVEGRVKYGFTDSDDGLRQEVKCQVSVRF